MKFVHSSIKSDSRNCFFCFIIILIGDKVICKSLKPYPKVEVLCPNEEYAKLLLEDYAGCTSEDTAIHLYLYQSLILREQNEELSKILEEISKVEMHHLKLLGETIRALGVKPVFGSSHDEWLIPWNASCVEYTIDLNEMLIADIAREEGAIKKYREHIASIDDEFIKALLERIIEDELVHLNIFYYFLQNLVVKNISCDG